MAQYTKSSPYYETGKFGNFLDVYKNRSIPKLVDDAQFTITESHRYRPDLLAFDLYQDSRLWWVFAVRNPNTIQDPIFDFIPGVTIFVPKYQTLVSSLGL
jgi:hypothetical protein